MARLPRRLRTTLHHAGAGPHFQNHEHEEIALEVFVSGATGFVGRALVARLQQGGHRITAWVRSPRRAASQLGADVTLLPLSDPDSELVAALDGADAVVNLAGENLFGGRWTARRKQLLVDSRVALTTRLVTAMAAATTTPPVLLSVSAIGFYGDRGEELLDESSAGGGDFLANLTACWEAAALQAEAAGSRVVLLRLGIVLGVEGGALGKLLRIFRLGLGGHLGNGHQYISWIHLEDLVEVFAAALSSTELVGPINVVAPGPVTNRRFTQLLAQTLGRPAVLSMPGFALKLATGESAKILLGGQNVDPGALRTAGFPFLFPELKGCLEDLLAR